MSRTLLAALALALTPVVACTPPATTPGEPTDTDPPATTVPTVPQTETKTPTGTTGTTATTGDTAPELDCSILPPVPVTYQVMREFDTAEDFDFDGDGYLCSIDNGNLVCLDQAGNTKLISPNVASGTAGTRILATGDWVVADVTRGAMIRVDAATGGQTVISSGLQYPNGVEVDADNMVYVAENSGARVRQIDAYTGEQWVVAQGLSQPNGVILSPDGNTLYVGSFGGGVIYAIDRLGPHEWDEERILYDPAGPDGGFDGINVDICGNVYITEFTVGRIYRIGADGNDRALVVDLPAGWIPNMRWGTNIGGWRSDVLYVSAWNRVFALEMQIEGKPHLLAAP